MPSHALSVVYASAPTDVVIIHTLEVLIPGGSPIRVCNGFEDQAVTLETGEDVVFEAGNLVFELPEKNDTGKQTLRFGVWNTTARAQGAVEQALASDYETRLIYREFVTDDLSAPRSLPQTFTLVGGRFQGLTVEFEGSYFDILNTAWPRDRYTQLNAPAIAYL